MRLEAIASRLEASAIRLEAIASRLEAVAIRLEANYAQKGGMLSYALLHRQSTRFCKHRHDEIGFVHSEKNWFAPHEIGFLFLAYAKRQTYKGPKRISPVIEYWPIGHPGF